MSFKDLYPQPVVEVSFGTNTVNENMGASYLGSPEWQLTKLITTGMLGDTFYVGVKDTQEKIFELAKQVSPEFLAKSLVYARNNGFMRHNPIQLLVMLSVNSPKLFRKVFHKVVHNFGDLLDFTKVVLSQQIRKELGTAPRDEIRKLLLSADSYQFIKYSGSKQNPSLKDIIRIAHPKPENDEQNALFAWAVDKREKETGNPKWDHEQLPEKVRAYLRFIELSGNSDPSAISERETLLSTGWLPHEKVTSYKLTAGEWVSLAQNMPYFATLRMLNTMNRHGVFEDKEALGIVVKKLSNLEAISRSKLLPYRYLSAIDALEANVPQAIKTALSGGLEYSLRNIPEVDGLVTVHPDVSGSMQGRVNPKSARTHLDIAALVTAAVFKRNPSAKIIPFCTVNHVDFQKSLNADDTVLTNTQKLSAYRGGGTDVSLPVSYILENELESKLKLLVAITDNESWGAGGGSLYGSSRTSFVEGWLKIHKANPEAKALLINVAPYTSDQIPEGLPGATMVSGFSDEVFNLMSTVVSGGVDVQLSAINSIDLEAL